VRAAEPPPSVRQTRSHPPGARAAVTPVAVHRGKDLRPRSGRPLVAPVGILPAHRRGGGAAREHVLVMTHLGQAGALVGRGRAAPTRGQRHEQGDRNGPHPFAAAKPPMTAITTPSAIFAAAPAARPSTAPQPRAPATPPPRAPQPGRRGPPSPSASPTPPRHSRSSPRNARPSTIAMVATPMVRNPVSAP